MAIFSYKKWHMASLDPRDRKIILGATVVFAIIRGLDYLWGKDTFDDSSTWERAFAPHWWGITFLAAGLILATSLLTRYHFGVWVGHSIAWIAYGILAIAYYQDALNRDALNGIRAGNPLLILAMLHFYWWLRTGPRAPDGISCSMVVERVMAPQKKAP